MHHDWDADSYKLQNLCKYMVCVLFNEDVSFFVGMMFWSLKSWLWFCISKVYINSHNRLEHCDAKFIHKFQNYFITASDCLNILFIVIGLEWDFCFLLGDGQSEVLGTTIKTVSNALDVIFCVFNQGTNFDKKFLKDSIIPLILKTLPSCHNAKNMKQIDKFFQTAEFLQDHLEITAVTCVSLARKANSRHRAMCTMFQFGFRNHKQICVSQSVKVYDHATLSLSHLMANISTDILIRRWCLCNYILHNSEGETLVAPALPCNNF